MPSLFNHHSHWQRLRWQILWGIVAAALPVLARVVFIPDPGRGLEASVYALWGSLAGIFIGILLTRNLGHYPGVEKASAIIPSFSAAFGIVFATFLMLRLDYSRWILTGAYFSAVIIFYLGYAQVFGRRQLKIGVVPLEDSARGLFDIAGVDWISLQHPNQKVPRMDAVAVDLRADLPAEWDLCIADFALSGIPVYHSKHLVESLTGRVELEHLSETSFGTLSPPYTYMSLKHAVDRIMAAVSLVVLLPLLIVVAILIRFNSPGPAIFKQERVGFRGKPFTAYKFRTMRIKALGDEGSRNDAITRANDDRITPFGRFLRQSRIDELPQIINVLKGQMSWIGPRPEAAVLSSWYESEISFYRYRHIVRPGITGWAQIMQGHVTDVEDVRCKLYYDFYYIKNFSFWIDGLILVRTLVTMMNGFGAK